MGQLENNNKESVNATEDEGLMEKMLMSLQSLCSYFYSHTNTTTSSSPRQRSRGCLDNGK